MAKTTKDNPVRLRAYLGLDEAGKTGVFVSTVPLNPLGPRCQKGTPFPGTLDVWLEHPSWTGAEMVLQDMQAYFDQLAKK